MASSSRPYQTLLPTDEFNFLKGDKAVQQEVEKEEEWLKLGLGLGLGCSSSPWNKIVGQNHKSNPILVSPSQTLISYPHIELGLGFEDKGSSLEPIRKGKEEMEHSFLMGWPSDNCYDDHHDDDDDNNGMALWPSSSSSCKIIMNPRGENLPLQIPSDSHHYWGRSNNLNQNQSGLWFTLRSFTNRSGEVLPQISKEYIRVKDENMTVLMVKKYLVTKLGLSNEAQIDISCLGESLLHIQTLKQNDQNRVINVALTLKGELVHALGGALATSSLLGVPLGHNSPFIQGPPFAPPQIRESIWCGIPNPTREEGKYSMTHVADIPIQEVRDCGVDDHRLMNVISEC